jgi:tetratricopeptide (TPR) repeat protein
MAAGKRVQSRGIQLARQRLDAKMGEERMQVGPHGGPQHGAKAPGIAQAQNPVGKQQIEVVVLLRRRAAWQDAKASGHSQMQNQVPVAAVHEQIFASTKDRTHRPAGKIADSRRDGPAQPRFANRYAGDHLAGKARRESAAGDLDFGKLGHRMVIVTQCACLFPAPNIPKMGRTKMFNLLKFMLPQLSKWTIAVLLALGALGACAQTGSRNAPELSQAAPGLNELTLYELLLAEIALQRGETALAAQTYLEVARRTRDPRVAKRTVEVANAAKLGDVAIEAAKIWQTIEPSSPQALQITAALLVAEKRVDEAEPYLEKLLAGEGVDLANGFLRLNRLLSGNPDRAANLRVVRKLAAQHPKLPEAHLAVAQAALSAEDDSSALSAVRSALSLRPDWEAAAILEAQVLQKGSPAAAVESLRAFVEKYPQARDARLNYARALVLDKRYADARKQFEAVLAANPGNTDVIYAVGLLAFQLKEFHTAEQTMTRLLGLGYRDPNAVRYLLGQIAEEQKQWPRAIEWYKEIETGDHALAARMRTAHALSKQGKLDEAREYLKRLEVDDPREQVQLIVAEAQLLRDANRPADAFEMLGQALGRDPDQPELLYDFALTAEKLERFDVLEENLRKLIQVQPDYAHAYNALGYSFAERNMRLPEARKLIERALELSPEDHFIIDSLGWVLYRQGDLKGALRELRRAYGGRPDAEIGAHLGEVLWVMGERAEAEKIWRESLRSAPENESLLKTIKRLKR